MDLRMWGQGFEEMYREAQEKYGVNFVRGRISEAASTFDNRVQIKAEDTLMGNPMTMNADLLVLMVGMCASEGTATLSKCAGIDGLYRFAQRQPHHPAEPLPRRLLQTPDVHRGHHPGRESRRAGDNVEL